MTTTDIVVIGAGPAGVFAARRAADLGARTTLITRAELGGMAANDGPVPVRTLAHAARLLRDAQQLGQYGIAVSEPRLDYGRLLERVSVVTGAVRTQSLRREHLEDLGVTISENAGTARFIDPHTIETNEGSRIQAGRFILCGGGTSRRISVPGFEFTATHSDAWGLTAIPRSMLVIGGGATGVQVASIFNAFGSRVQLYQSGPRILTGEDEDVSAAVGAAFRELGIEVHEDFGAIDSFEKTADGVRMMFSRDGVQQIAEAELAVVAVGWVADTKGLDLEAAEVEVNERGFIRVDSYLRTSADHIFAAGDITGRLMLVPQATQDGFVAATNAVQGAVRTFDTEVSPVGSFTDPEYAQVGLTESAAREKYDVAVGKVQFDETARTIIDGRTTGFCKLIGDRQSRKILGCHVVGERAVEIVQVVAVAIAAGMKADELARLALSFPTYAGILVRAAYRVTEQLDPQLARQLDWRAQ
jgi:pyruvate/2-oxoglutarate dehydrogenase complex dihydrolipoamide dehydrogenase (E3) component